MLEPAATAASEVRAGGLDPEGGRLAHRLDGPAREPGPDLPEPDVDPVSRHAARHEHDEALGPAHAFSTEREVGDHDGDEVTAARFLHMCPPILRDGYGPVNDVAFVDSGLRATMKA